MDPCIEVKRQNVAIIGSSGSGKTCFIAALRWLGECGTNTRFISVGANGDAKRYLDDLHRVVNSGGVPAGTPEDFALDFSERYLFKPEGPPVQIDFSMHDFKGGDLPALDADSPLFQSWTRCGLLMVLLDIAKIREGGCELLDDLRNLSAVLIRDEMDAAGKRLAVVLTQADKGPFTESVCSSEAAEAFLEEKLPEFLARLRTSGFKDIRCFPLASIGFEPEKHPDGRTLVPEIDGRRLWQPFGYEELFDWICAFRRTDAKEGRRDLCRAWTRLFLSLLMTAALVAVGILGAVRYPQHKAWLRYQNPNATLEEKAVATWEMGNDDRNELIEEKITDYGREVEELRIDEAALRKLYADNGAFFKAARRSEEQRIRVDEIDVKLVDFIDVQFVSRIKNCYQSGDVVQTRKLIGEYWAEPVIKRGHQDEVKKIGEQLFRDEYAKARLEIASYDVGPAGNTTRMAEKLKLIQDFPYMPDTDKQDVDRAIAAMQRLMQGTFTFTQINAEGLGKKRKTYVLVGTGINPKKDLKQAEEDGELTPVRTKTIDSVCPQWSGDRMGDYTNLLWKPGQSVKVEWRRDSLCSDKRIASAVYMGDEWLGLLKILQPDGVHVDDDYGNFTSDGPKVTIQCSEFPNAREDLELIKRYVLPGTYWNDPQP